MLHQLSADFEKSDHMTETNSTASSATCEDRDLQIQIVCQESLNQLWNGLKQGTLNGKTSLQISFRLNTPHLKISKLKRLEDVFVAIGKLPGLEEIVFDNADLLVSMVQKLLKKSSLKTLKFHNCTLVAKKIEDVDRKLWNGIQLQSNLTTLEIIRCSYTASDTQCRVRTAYAYSIPGFLQEHNLTSLRRLVLDGCLYQQESFAKLLSNNTSLKELEIRPSFDDPSVHRRQQYQAKKQAIRSMMVETIPDGLASNDTLKKLVVSLEDYHLEKIYADTMSCWIDLVQDGNCTLTELRATHLPLGACWKKTDRYAAKKTKEEELYEYAGSYLHHNLKSVLRLNQVFWARQRQEQKQCPEKAGELKDTSVAQTEGTSEQRQEQKQFPEKAEELRDTSVAQAKDMSEQRQEQKQCPEKAEELKDTSVAQAKDTSESEELITEVWV